MNKRKRRKRKSRIILFIIFLIICSILYFVLFRTIKEIVKPKYLDEIKEYGYTLDKRDSELMKTTFASLKEELAKEKVDEEMYAKYISELFIIDLYTINNKNTKSDVGGVDYIYTDYKENYKKNVQDTLYYAIGSISKSKFPEVSNVEVNSIEETTFTYNEITYNGYNVSLSWDYVEDFGYDNEGVVTIIKSKDKLYISQLDTEVEE